MLDPFGRPIRMQSQHIVFGINGQLTSRPVVTTIRLAGGWDTVVQKPGALMVRQANLEGCTVYAQPVLMQASRPALSHWAIRSPKGMGLFSVQETVVFLTVFGALTLSA